MYGGQPTRAGAYKEVEVVVVVGGDRIRRSGANGKEGEGGGMRYFTKKKVWG